MPSAREIALKLNDRAKFGDDSPGYDAEAGVPAGVASKGTPEDYRANPTNPPEGPVPAKNLKR